MARGSGRVFNGVAARRVVSSGGIRVTKAERAFLRWLEGALIESAGLRVEVTVTVVRPRTASATPTLSGWIVRFK